jgi:hypothetical protein
MPTTVRLHGIIASTPETVDSALLELEGTPAPLRRRTYLARFGVHRDDHANVGRTGPPHHQSYGQVM